MKEIKLHSRYKNVNTICTIYDDYGIVKSDGGYSRIIGLIDNIEAIDFDGGPMIYVGDHIGGKEIEKITFEKEGYRLKWKV